MSRTTDTHEDTRPLPVRYTIYSAELAPYCPDLPEDPDGWTDDLEQTLRDFAQQYGETLTDALRAEYPGRPVWVDLVHATTGSGSGTTCTEPEDEENVREIANSVLEQLTAPDREVTP